LAQFDHGKVLSVEDASLAASAFQEKWPSPLSASGHLSRLRPRDAAKLPAVNEEEPILPDHSILLLDDDPGVGLAAQLLLQRRVAPITCLRRPAELMAAIAKLRPSVLLLDLNFGPGRTEGEQGLQLLAEVQKLSAPPVVVVMTAYADIELAVQALRRGAFDFITKPWDNVRLIATCSEALQRFGQLAQRDLSPASASTFSSEQTEPARSLAAQERAALLAAMAAAEGNLSAAARTLGLSRAALYRRLDKHGL
jgi:DNA-binding NtrC family response regulator